MARIPRHEARAKRAELFSWGQNAYGELAHGDLAERAVPETVAFVRENELDVKQVVAGNEHTALLTEGGGVYCCGYNDSGQCGVGHVRRVHALERVSALDGKDVTQLCSANGCEHIFAITASGELYAWGYNNRGQLGLGVESHVSLPRQVESLRTKQVSKVACSYYHSLVSTADNLIYSFGRNDYGQLGVGDTLDKPSPALVRSVPHGAVSSIACGQYHSVLSIDGVGVYSCGKNDYGQLGTPGGGEPQILFARVDTTPGTPLPRHVASVACGYYHSVALTDDGQVFSWGRNDYGQLGLGDKEMKRRPHRVLGIPPIKQISSGCYHTLMLSSDGRLYAQGRNNHGQLGTSAGDDTVVPVKIEALEGVVIASVAAGFYHSVCLTPSAEAIPEPPKPTLSEDLRAMLNNPARSDVQFKVDGETIFAHRVFIMARCEPLSKMLDGPMKESSQDVIELPDLQAPIFLALIEFLYTDQVGALSNPMVDIDFALDLQALADKFLVDRLKALCEIAIDKSVDVENVALTFQIADARNAAHLRQRCFDFILREFSKVVGTEGFVQLPRDLLREIFLVVHQRGVIVRQP